MLKNRIIIRACCLTLLYLTFPATADTNSWIRFWNRPGILHGNSFRERWEERGVRWNAYLLYYQGALLDGGLGAPAHRGSSSADLIGRMDLEQLVGWEGADLLTHLKSMYGRNINPSVGARSQAIDDADFTDWFWIDQLWLRQRFWDRRLQLQLGYLDLQTILDRNAYANSEDKQFMAQYLDNNNAIIPLKVGLGAALHIDPDPNWSGSLGFADADNRTRVIGFNTFFDGTDSLVWFAQVTRRTRLGGLPGNWRIGAYHDARSATVFGTTDRQSGHPGMFLSCDQMLFREHEGSAEGLGAFVRYGWHDGDVNRFAHFWSTGFQYDGPLPGRGADRWGAAIYSIHASDTFRAAGNPAFTRETGYETYYRIQVSPWLTLTPNLQYIANPGGSSVIDDAVAANLRLRFTF